MKQILPLGKLDFPILDRLLKKYSDSRDSRVLLGPTLGEDAAVIEFPDRYLVTKTDPERPQDQMVAVGSRTESDTVFCTLCGGEGALKICNCFAENEGSAL